MKTEVSMRDPAPHHFGELWGQFWLHFDPHLAPKIVPQRVRSASRALPEAIREAVWPSLGGSWSALGALGPFSSAPGPPGGTPAPVWDQFSENLAWIWRSIRQRQKAFTTSLSKKKGIVSPLQTLEDVVRTCRETHSTKTSGHILQSGYWAVGTVAG